MSLGSDQEIRIWSLLNPQLPIHVISTGSAVTTSINWSPARPLVFTTTSSLGEVQIFDFKMTKIGPIVAQRASEKKVTFSLTCQAFNIKDKALMATGDSLGKLQIWKLNNELLSSDALEVKGLDDMSLVVGEE